MGLLGGVQGGRTLGLVVGEVIALDGTPEGLVGQVAVGGSIDGENEGWEVDVKPRVVGTNKAASRLREVCAKTVEGFGEGWNM